MKRTWVIILFLTVVSFSQAQTKNYPFYQLYQLDSIAKTPSISRHFGELYAKFLRLVELQLPKVDTGAQKLLRRFEMVFAQFYIDAAFAYRDKKPIEHSSWRTYFSDSALSRPQYYLYGTNAHLNGQLSEAIAESYTADEWRRLKKHYHIFNYCLNEVYRYVYLETLLEHKRARTLHFISFGLDKPFASYLLYKWRKRQMRVTEYRFKNSPKHEKLFAKIQRKKKAIDRLILLQLLDREGRAEKKITSARLH